MTPEVETILRAMANQTLVYALRVLRDLERVREEVLACRD